MSRVVAGRWVVACPENGTNFRGKTGEHPIAPVGSAAGRDELVGARREHGIMSRARLKSEMNDTTPVWNSAPKQTDTGVEPYDV